MGTTKINEQVQIQQEVKKIRRNLKKKVNNLNFDEEMLRTEQEINLEINRLKELRKNIRVYRSQAMSLDLDPTKFKAMFKK